MLPHSTPQAILASADIIIITFEFQKNDWRNHTVHMFCTNDPLLCPVKAGAAIVHRILSTIPNASPDTKLCSFCASDGSTSDINSAQVLPWLRAIVELIGESILGFSKDDIGLHSIRSGGAMAMFLAGISTVILRRIGRWSSEAFLEYIREQVESFTYGVAQRMLSYEHFFTLNHSEEPTSASSTADLEDIFVANTEDGETNAEPVCIDHQVTFTELSLGNSPTTTTTPSSETQRSNTGDGGRELQNSWEGTAGSDY